MPGVRIQHPTERNCTFTIVDATRPYRPAWDCPACHRIHQFKTIHLTLDEAGSVIVSEAVLEVLKKIPLNPFRITNEVAKPPEQKLWLPTARLQVAVKET